MGDDPEQVILYVLLAPIQAESLEDCHVMDGVVFTVRFFTELLTEPHELLMTQ